MNRFLIIYLFLFILPLFSHAEEEGDAENNITEIVGQVNTIGKLIEEVEKDSYEMTKDFCYFFEFRHKYGNEDALERFTSHPARLLAELPFDQQLQRSMYLLWFLFKEDFFAAFSDSGQAKHAVLFRSIYSTFLPSTQGFLRASRECGAKIGRKDMHIELAQHLSANSTLAAMINFGGLWRVFDLAIIGIRSIPYVKRFLNNMNPKKRKALKWSIIGSGASLMAIMGYHIYIEIKEENAIKKQGQDILNGEQPLIPPEIQKDDRQTSMEYFLRRFQGRYYDKCTSDTPPEACPEAKKIYKGIFDKNKEFLGDMLCESKSILDQFHEENNIKSIEDIHPYKEAGTYPEQEALLIVAISKAIEHFNLDFNNSYCMEDSDQ